MKRDSSLSHVFECIFVACVWMQETHLCRMSLNASRFTWVLGMAAHKEAHTHKEADTRKEAATNGKRAALDVDRKKRTFHQKWRFCRQKWHEFHQTTSHANQEGSRQWQHSTRALHVIKWALHIIKRDVDFIKRHVVFDNRASQPIRKLAKTSNLSSWAMSVTPGLHLSLSHSMTLFFSLSLFMTRTTTHRNTLTPSQTQGYTALHCNTLKPYLLEYVDIARSIYIPTHCNTLKHNATHYNTMQHTTTHFNTLQHTATHCTTLHLSIMAGLFSMMRTRSLMTHDSWLMTHDPWLIDPFWCKTTQDLLTGKMPDWRLTYPSTK